MTAPAYPDPDRLLARLTGPAGPQLSCEECFEQLDHYVELELDGANADAASSTANRMMSIIRIGRRP